MRIKNDRQAHFALTEQVNNQKIIDGKVTKKSVEKWILRERLIKILMMKKV